MKDLMTLSPSYSWPSSPCSTHLIKDKPWTALINHELFKRVSFAVDLYSDQYILVAGGFRERVILGSAGIYDIKTGTYDRLPNLPGPENNHDRCGGAILNGFFYVVSHGSVYRMELSSPRKKWKQISTAEFKLRRVEAVVSNERYLFAFNEKHNMKFDPERLEWNDLPGPLHRRCEFTCVGAEDNIYIIGGYASGNYLASVEKFHIPTSTWSEVPPLPQALVGSAAAYIRRRWIVVTGGYLSEREMSSKCYIFDTWTQKWTTNTLGLSPPRAFHCCIATSTGRHCQIISIGGKRRDRTVFSMKTIQTKLLIQNWDYIKHFVLLRELVDRGRALPNLKPSIGPNFHNIDLEYLQEDQDVIKRMITELSSDMFRTILTYLF